MSFLKDIWFVFKPFWHSNSSFRILFVLSVCIILEFVSVGLSVYLNYWYVDFYNSIQNYNYQLLIHQLIAFVGIVFFMLVNSFLLYIVSQIFIIKIRNSLTQIYTEKWLYSKHYACVQETCDNPDERISNDIKEFVSILRNLFLGFIGSVLTFVLFSYILWELSGSVSFKFLGYNLVVKGYLFWLAVLLAGLNAYIVIKVGKPLRKLVYEKQKFEAEFRYNLANIRGNKNTICESGLEKFKVSTLKQNFSQVVDNFYKLTFREVKINIVTGLFSQVYAVIGIFLSLPRYFAKVISFGQVMQINAAFLKVVSPLLFFVYSYESVAKLKANVQRLKELKLQIDVSDNRSVYKIEPTQEQFLNIKNLDVSNPKERLLIGVNLSLTQGESVFIKGPVGVGKTTFLRVLNGLNHDFEGEISYNTIPMILFLSSNPYFPKDDFKRAVFSSNLSNIPTDDEFVEILEDLGLEHLAKFVGQLYDWKHLLSAGELKSLAFCRLYTNDYNLVIIDEALTNTSVSFKEKIYKLLKQKGISYISSSHNNDASEYHDKIVCLSDYRVYR
ncbi:ABC transporter ATP-binding protein/permease [Francisella adeliensis]|uniref:ABC transporter ATP-binding protein/permease n=1 Tax=Francisella adeliensis TaxID=2007306 RepID=A0A2Z4Y1G7_9GAMM|nr:SbmA/BacA-like family transporter [Francisella adeliensis]AXA34335.1 hypothetical protein CDH04_07955 [Francisella adeliensis]MBK2084677.1 ABC transporter ATP-binding protein/permease [Francisella adeliensis]MBK2096186.1 ABC transporter ATP-binding protein/permease [Francisella adeliensis]QIW12582.1 ABC transporter ATP-binding protein/permease [Francisella adeliensis]QIW14455.1 ABC transporter ATP-binding protein/permease [Francisella adeliensis]